MKQFGQLNKPKSLVVNIWLKSSGVAVTLPRSLLNCHWQCSANSVINTFRIPYFLFILLIKSFYNEAAKSCNVVFSPNINHFFHDLHWTEIKLIETSTWRLKTPDLTRMTCLCSFNVFSYFFSRVAVSISLIKIDGSDVMFLAEKKLRELLWRFLFDYTRLTESLQTNSIYRYTFWTGWVIWQVFSPYKGCMLQVRLQFLGQGKK